ncbi:MAG TPA: flagellar biosynthetic protein FliR [Vicinamibacterales bacterium]|nr:flagellar biosynthetic protein FliR [Vicinamibacterales bacterium]
MNGFGAITGISLLLVRPGMVIVSTPFFGRLYAPAHVRAGLSLLLALAIAPFVPQGAAVTGMGMTVAIIREAAIGLSIGMSIRVLVAGIELAGQLSGYQAGFSYGALVDPQGGVRNPLVSALYANVAVLFCFMTDVHHALLRALVSSYHALPIGTGGMGPDLAAAVAKMLGQVFIIGARLATPFVVVLLLVEIAMGLMARVAPSLNPMAVGAPLRGLVGLLAISWTVSSLPSFVNRYAPSLLQLAADTARIFR